MTKIFKVPFAVTGDKISPPDAVQSDGSVSYSQGYGFDYQRKTDGTDPLAKVFPREQHNGILNDITTAIGEMQAQGHASWQLVGAPYQINAIVRHSGMNWRSTVSNNSTEPGTPSSYWVDSGSQPQATESSAGVAMIASPQDMLSGSNDTKIVTPKKLRDSQATQQEAEAGTENRKLMTPLRTIQAIRSAVSAATETLLGVFRTGTQPEINAGVLDDVVVTPKKLRNGFSASMTANGYIALPTWLSGIIFQWGRTAETTSTTTAQFTIGFPNRALFVTEKVVGAVDGGVISGTVSIIQIGGISNTGFTIRNVGTLTAGSASFGAPVLAATSYFALGF